MLAVDAQRRTSVDLTRRKFPMVSKINTWLLDGNPSGIRIAQFPELIVQAIAFRREHFDRARDELPKRKIKFVDGLSATYILTGLDDDGSPTAYIGKSDKIVTRLENHVRGLDNPMHNPDLSFWDETLIFISRVGYLTSGHALYMESRLFHSAEQSTEWKLKYGRRPDPEAGGLEELEQNHMDEKVIPVVKILAEVLGCNLFVESPLPSGKDSPEFIFRDFNGRLFNARMIVESDGSRNVYVVKRGSRARITETGAIPQNAAKERSRLVELGILRPDGDYLIFDDEVHFKSPSAAAKVVAGRSDNGLTAWRLPPDNVTLGEWLRTNAN